MDSLVRCVTVLFRGRRRLIGCRSFLFSRMNDPQALCAVANEHLEGLFLKLWGLVGKDAELLWGERFCV